MNMEHVEVCVYGIHSLFTKYVWKIDSVMIIPNTQLPDHKRRSEVFKKCNYVTFHMIDIYITYARISKNGYMGERVFPPEPF